MRLDPLFQFVAELVDLPGEADRIVIEADLVDEQHVPPGDGDGGRSPELIEPLQGPPAVIDKFDGRLSFAAVIVLPVISSILSLNRRISVFHRSRSQAFFIWGISMT